MNSCILMGTIMSDPELRYTPDQLEVSQMLLEFDTQQNDRTSNSTIMARLKVVGFSNLAKEIKERYHQGDRVVVVGRLAMNTIERDGYKEKRAELNLSHIYPVGEGSSSDNSSSSDFNSATRSEPDRSSQSARENVIPIKSYATSEPEDDIVDANVYGYESEEIPSTNKNLDEIPF
jgi:single-strand DNA-binding protein